MNKAGAAATAGLADRREWDAAAAAEVVSMRPTLAIAAATGPSSAVTAGIGQARRVCLPGKLAARPGHRRHSYR
ncbi:hypothetical protein MPRM_01180 [Mycobacterium parmense]|uniref:Uncharacterized protein n=1 Tax=Mycobacterium parmense TaxID=185642 RepID=A0A7I7YND9_9MYCO|nr:hypothetical protein MPRM_01180 [Mycobacterium parmense]